MNSLKRTLSLVLVLVMVLGLFGIAGAAYTDEAKIQYKEAVNVMTGIGAIEGDNGAFNPTGSITRAAAAKMVAYTVLGADVAKNLPVKVSSFKDVNANFAWAIPSIEYLVSRGVIEGYNKTTFGPNDPVTGNQLAKMLLCAVGYGKKGEFSDASWELNTAILARKNGIFDNSKATDFSKAATREEAALYCFNALTGVKQVVWSKDIEDYSSKDKNTLGVDVYSLAKIPGATVDTYKRPASVWTAEKVTGSTTKPIAEVASTPVATYTNATYATAFAKSTYDFDDALKIYVNGSAYNTNDPSVLASRALNGTGIELYNTDSDKDIDVIVMTQGYLAKATKFVATKGTNYGYFTVTVMNPWAGTPAASKTVTDTKATDDLYDQLLAAGLKENAFLTIYTEGADLSGNIMKFAAVTSATGTLSTYSATNNAEGFNGTVTVGGTKYVLASACVENTVTGFISNDGESDASKLSSYLNKNVTVILDQYGMVVGIVAEKIADSTTYGLVLGYQYNKATLTKPASAEILLAMQDGTVAVFAQPAGANGVIADMTGTFSGHATFVSYTIADSKLVAISTTAGVDGPLANEYSAKGTMMDLTGEKDLYLNYATTFIYFDNNKAYNANTNPVKVVTGYANTSSLASDKSVKYVLDSTLSAVNNVAKLVYVPTAANVTVANNYIYIFDKNFSVSAGATGTPVYTYNGFVNGAAASITTGSPVGAIDAAGLYTYEMVNGIATNVSKASADNAGVVTVFDPSYVVTTTESGSNTVAINSSTVFYLVDGIDKTITAGAIVPVAGKTYTVVNVIAGTNAAAAIYYTVA